MFTFEEVKKYISDINTELFDLSILIEKDLREIKETKSEFIYSIKSRIKSPESTFIKLRRKGESIENITDLLGMRVHCLYEDDIDGAHIDILTYFSSNKYILKEINIYASWENKRIRAFISNACMCLNARAVGWNGKVPEKLVLNTKDDDDDEGSTKIEYTNKDSGYESVHYTIGITKGSSVLKKIKFEIQLRTILQDVWAEIEHDISYKKSSVHPHAKKLFENLSKNLIDVQRQIETIREIQAHDQRWTEFFNERTKQVFLHYDEDYKINEKMKSYDAEELYDEYVEKAERQNIQRSEESAIKELEKLLFEINKKIDVNINNSGDSLSYFIVMEKAFILMLKRELKEAYGLYKNYIINDEYKSDSDRYAIYFRIGEIKYLDGNKVDAFIMFDKCESLMRSIESHPINKFNVYQRMANIYWSLGIEYYETSLDKIKEAEEVYKKTEKLMDSKNATMSYLNNICWYHLALVEKNISKSNTNKAFSIVQENLKKAEEYYNKIEKECEKNDTMYQNMADTAAWYCYLKTKHTEKYGEKSECIYWILKAEEWANKIINDNMENKGMNPLRSIELHRQHIQMILEEKNRITVKG